MSGFRVRSCPLVLFIMGVVVALFVFAEGVVHLVAWVALARPRRLQPPRQHRNARRARAQAQGRTGLEKEVPTRRQQRRRVVARAVQVVLEVRVAVRPGLVVRHGDGCGDNAKLSSAAVRRAFSAAYPHESNQCARFGSPRKGRRLPGCT